MTPPARSQEPNVAVTAGALLLAVACCAGPFLVAAVAAFGWAALVAMLRDHATLSAVALVIVIGLIFLGVGLVKARIIPASLTSKACVLRGSDEGSERVSVLGGESNEQDG